MTTLNDIAPWPGTENETPAHSLAKALTVRAYARSVWAKENVADPFVHSIAVESIQADYALVRTLRGLVKVDPVAADEMAVLILRAWAEGDTAPALWRLLSGEYRIDPYDVAATSP